jgi:ABC-type iron transport system FetAB ATPase subunit
MPAVNISGLSAHGVQVAGSAPLQLQVAPGECVTLAGASGSGKTLLLRALADLDPHSGEVRLGSEDACSLPPSQWRRKVGLLLAESPWWHERVGEHFPAGYGDDFQLAALGFAPAVLGWQVLRLSSGERQRLALLRLLALQPAALLLDEPTANLDPENTARVEQLVSDYRQRWRAPVLWVSHDAQQRDRIADRQLTISAEGIGVSP